MSRDGTSSDDDIVDVDNVESPQLVTIAGAGPAGLMLASNLARFGIRSRIIDNRDDKTSTGRADGLQPKTIETFQQLRLADSLLRKGVKIYDICFWHSSSTEKLHRQRREIHYPPDLDVENPFILLVHQGMVEDVFLDDMRERGVEVDRGLTFSRYETETGHEYPIKVKYTENKSGRTVSFPTKYLVGCDGARGHVRPSIPEAEMIGESSNSKWGVLDGVIETNFPDLWSKVVIHSETAGTVLCIPRERNMTRLYIELDRSLDRGSERATQDLVMKKAQEIMAPYSVRWTSVEWFSVYKVGQRVSSKFSDATSRIFIAGDAAHTHSPKAAQGMNTSMHDTFNLSWKLNLHIRGLGNEELLSTYQHERQKIAQDLINFDFEHAAAFTNGDAKALAENFATNVGFISGFGVKYAENILNVPERSPQGCLRAGELLHPAKVTRYIDANPVNLELDVPLLGQFRVYFFVPNVRSATNFLTSVCAHLNSADSIIGNASVKAAKSYAKMPASTVESDEFLQPSRYTSASRLFTFALITQTPKADFELEDLPPLLYNSKWTVYLDDMKDVRTGLTCTEKMLGELDANQIAVVNVRPDGYVGAIRRFDCSQDAEAKRALDQYYGGFLSV